MFFIVLIALTALFVAGCSAFFSIKGLTVLFSGSAIAVGIMASSLELGKLVAASFLHNHWKNISRLLRLYLCAAVVILMGITSLGIFGFLSNAYQEHAGVLRSIDAKIEMVENGRKSTLETVELNTSRIKSLNEIRATQEQRIKDSGNLKAPREQAYKAISEANEELAKKEQTLKEARENLASLDEELGSLKVSANASTDIGSFKFIAKTLNTDLDTAVQYFIFALIAVFDPLAVTLVLALNRLIELRAEKKKYEDDAFLKSVIERPVVYGVAAPIASAVQEMSIPTSKESAQAMVEETVPPSESAEALTEESLSEVANAAKERRRKVGGANKSIITS